MIIDLRSDTVTQPTPAMREAMMQAAVGDDVYGEDPTTKRLEAKLAAMFGKERALFFPTGTMANQAAIKLHTQPGEQLICDHWAHVYNYEGGGASFNSGVSCKLIAGRRGMITAEQVEAHINPPDFYHSPLTRLVCVENTTNKGGGACYDPGELERIKAVCDRHGLGYHLDGARLFNALVATGDKPEVYGRLFDTLSVCLSKGLGAPIGSVLIGDANIMERALRIRKVLGGGMRQVGYMAAAGLYALDNHIDRLADDHKRAQEIGQTLEEQNYISSVETVETNLVIFYLHPQANREKFLQQLLDNRIKISEMGEGKWRIVTHLDYTEGQHQRFLEVLRGISVD